MQIQNHAKTTLNTITCNRTLVRQKKHAQPMVEPYIHETKKTMKTSWLGHSHTMHRRTIPLHLRFGRTGFWASRIEAVRRSRGMVSVSRHFGRASLGSPFSSLWCLFLGCWGLSTSQILLGATCFLMPRFFLVQILSSFFQPLGRK